MRVVDPLDRDISPPSLPSAKATLLETWTDSADASAAGFVLATLRGGHVMWVQDRITAREIGTPYGPGLGRAPILVRHGRAADGLVAMEAGLGCPSLAAVVGEVWGDPACLDFTATKRLALRAEASGVVCWLIRRGAAPSLSAARERWRVTALPSEPAPFDPKAPGAPRWRAELFRSRSARTGIWIAQQEVRNDGSTHRLRLLPASGHGAVDAAVPLRRHG